MELLLEQLANPVPMVRAGERVKEGDLVAASLGCGAALHSSINGRVVLVDDGRIVITRKG